MEVLENRIASFSKPKRIKGSKKALKWPHNDDFKATPHSLAEAGFYYNPSSEDKDNVTCFMCEKNLSDWEAEDDPFDIHWDKCGQKCPWAIVRCGLRRDMDRNDNYTFPNKTRIPTTKVMEKARLDTFNIGDGWLHDQDRNHGASSQKMAQAGFIYTPQHPSDDLVTCVYCSVSLGGWDRDDDPLEEHRKREKKTGKACAFVTFLASSQASSALESKKPSSRSSAKPPSRASANPLPPKSKSSRTLGHTRSVSSHVDSFEPTKTHDGDIDRDADDSDYFSATSAGTSTAAVKKGAKTPRKPKGTSGAKTPGPRSQAKARSRSRGAGLGDVEEDTEEDEELIQPEFAISAGPKLKKKTKGKANAVIEGDEGDPPAPAPMKHARTRSKSTKQKVGIEVVAEEEGLQAKPARTRSKSVSKKAQEETPEDEETSRKSKARGKGRTKAVNSCEEAEVPKVQRGRTPTVHKRPLQRDTTAADTETVDKLENDTENDCSLDQMQVEADEEPSPPVQASRKGEHTGQTDQPQGKSQHQFKVSAANSTVSKTKSTTRDIVSDHPDVVQVPSDDEMNLEEDVSMLDFSNETDEKSAQLPSPLRQPSPNSLMQKVTTTKLSQKQPVVEILRPLSKQNTARGDRQAAPMETVEPAPPIDVEMPVTPPRNSGPALPTLPQLQESQTQGIQPPGTDYPTPPLALLPFTPIQSLATAELDMTVEQWIRYQMGVEFDKFKRDGERELERFKQRAEDVRRLIEEL